MIEPRKHLPVQMGSERSFGFTFALACGVLSVWPVIKGGAPRLWLAASALAFLMLALLRPAHLRPLNVVWFRLGLLLSAVTTPVVMGLLYGTTFLPTSAVLRLTGRDPLALKREPGRASYWTDRDPGDGAQPTMKHQY
jgi:Saxitoxin biosynthesis operon protein SxtJ